MARAPEMGDACRPGGSCPECNAKPPKCASPFCEERVQDRGDFCLDCQEIGDEWVAEEDKPWPGVAGV